MKYFLKDISEINNIDRDKAGSPDSPDWIGVLPLGATEGHGPHLPTATDSLIAEGIVNRLMKALPERVNILFFPVEEIGYSPEHMDYSGSKTLSYREAIERWIKKGKLLHARGIKKMIMLNAHGGNSPLMTIAAMELRVRLSMLAVTTGWMRLVASSQLVSAHEQAFGIHAGDIETSVMLALHPDQVNLGKARKFSNFQEKLTEKNDFLLAYGKHGFGWKMQDLNPHGAVGDASLATAWKGKKLLEHSVNALMKLIEEVEQFDMAHLKNSDRSVRETVL